MDQISRGLISIFVFLISSIPLSYGYDSLDPNGNITIKWDIIESTGNTNNVIVSIFNFQLFRHVEPPGWRLGWEWQGDEVIWNLVGAEATEQGNCSKFQTPLPHCCQKKPVIIDLLPGVRFDKQFRNCCRGGVLSSMTQDPSKYGASFQMSASSNEQSSFVMPGNFSLGLPGYTCGDPYEVPPTKSTVDGRRWTQALMTWNVTCSFSQIQASESPTCCVSLSAFYNDTITGCPKCSCGCQGLPGTNCVKPGETPQLLQLPNGSEKEQAEPVVRCSEHMCPIRVHWHVKVSYKDYWRVKVTVTNFNFVQNYSQWSLVVVHPNLKSVNRVFSFNYQPLNQYGNTNDTGMFWGIPYYNDMLLQSGESGNVQSEILLHKDPGDFTFKNGWTFPSKISFNGMECVMPPPDEYPTLPNRGYSHGPAMPFILFFSLLLLIVNF